MRLSYISLFALLSACSAVTPQPEAKPTEAKTAPQAAPANTPAATAPIVAPAVLPKGASFDEWKQSFIAKATAKGFDPVFVAQVLSDVTPLSSVMSSDSQQPEFSKPTSTYIRNTVTASRYAAARGRLDANANTPEIVQTYGVPSAILGGIWTMESDLGRVQGNIDVVAALATLAYDGRRRDWAENELLASLKILRDSGIARSTLKGSWAGAMGQTQFLPDNYLRLGIDGDHDGKVDIWNSDSDALASSANLLAKAGWKSGEDWAVEVMLPVGFDYYQAETAKKTPAEWAALGVKRADKGYWRPAELTEQATILLPAGAKGPAFMALPNHYVIRKYNNSTAYALAVGLLADGIAGKPELVTPWPVEPPLSLDQRLKTQTALKAAGFDPGGIDGVIGTGTRAAIREWQRANRLTPDGYLSFDLANRFVEMAGGTPAARPD
ncbi:MAG: lytic murein transglycosylase [Asticcacaulis sp.]